MPEEDSQAKKPKKKGWKSEKRAAPKERGLTPKQIKRKADLVKRRERAVEMRARGASFAKIAEELHYDGANRAYADVMRAHREVMAPNVEELRQDAWNKLQRWDELLSMQLGEPVERVVGEEVVEMVDHELDVKRIAVARQLLKDVRELFGLDAPRRVHLDAAILNLTAEDVERMTTADIEHVLTTGKMPAAPSLRLVGKGETHAGNGTTGPARPADADAAGPRKT